MQSMPIIPQAQPVTERCASLSVETRIEMATMAIAERLYDAHQFQLEGLYVPYGKAEPEVRRVFEAIGRQAAHAVLKPAQTKLAKQRAVDTAEGILAGFARTDADDERPVPFDVQRRRLESVITAALHRYHLEMAREEVTA